MDINSEHAQGWPNLDPHLDRQDFPSDTFEYFARVFGCSVDDLRNEQPWTGLDRAEAPIEDGNAEKPKWRCLINSVYRKEVRKRTKKALADLKPAVIGFWEIHGSGQTTFSSDFLGRPVLHAADGTEKQMPPFDAQQAAALLAFAFEYCAARIDAIEQTEHLSSESAQSLATELELKAFRRCLRVFSEAAPEMGVAYPIENTFLCLASEGQIWLIPQLQMKLRAKLYALSSKGAEFEPQELDAAAVPSVEPCADGTPPRQGPKEDPSVSLVGASAEPLPPSNGRLYKIDQQWWKSEIRGGGGRSIQVLAEESRSARVPIHRDTLRKIDDGHSVSLRIAENVAQLYIHLNPGKQLYLPPGRRH